MKASWRPVFYRVEVLISALCALLFSFLVYAQDTEMARKKCVEFGFKDKTANHESCVKQLLQSIGGGKAPSKPAAAPAAPAVSPMQREDKFWDDAKAAGNKEAFNAYLKIYPKGRFAELANANLLRLGVISPTLNQPLKIAFVYVGPVGDAGWTFAHDLGRQAAETEYGDKIETTFVEKVPEGPDAERVIRDLVQQGNKIIIATSFGYMEPMLKVAKDFPDVKFEHATGYKTASNLRVYDNRTYEGAYLAGTIAGKMTKTDILGYVGSVPIPEVLRNINAFTLGAQAVNPKIKTKVVWANTWFDPILEAKATETLINAGADVLFQNTDSTAVLQTAEKMGKRAFGFDSNMADFAPKAHLGSVVTNFGPYYIKSVGDALSGKWTTGQVWWGVKEGAVDLVAIADDVPNATKKYLADTKSKLRDGSFKIWKGPIMDNTGKVFLANGVIADDRFLAVISKYVKGVDGKVPDTK
jgi:basic membrane protein A